MEKVRLDKWLWAVRIYKTRSMASDACRNGRVFVNSQPVKPSRDIVVGDNITVRKMPVIYSYVVKQLSEKRMSAKMVPDYLEDNTSLEELGKLRVQEVVFSKRQRGTGRPTKKERRQLDDLRED
ncbi:MAG: RNA-binding S4 domain-containing protein [Bacteroidales bacterium]|nr:RNA-binding S4 domain-containing protein [Bacteroidales bacterium]